MFTPNKTNNVRIKRAIIGYQRLNYKTELREHAVCPRDYPKDDNQLLLQIYEIMYFHRHNNS